MLKKSFIYNFILSVIFINSFICALDGYPLEGGVISGDARVTPYFIPQNADTFSDDLVQSLNGAKDYVLVASYWITSDVIMKTLINLKNKNIGVRVIYDHSMDDFKNLSSKKEFDNIVAPVASYFGYKGKMHNKFIVIDDHIVWTGSANLTNAALGTNKKTINNESFLMIESPRLAKKFKESFELIERDVFKDYVMKLAEGSIKNDRIKEKLKTSAIMAYRNNDSFKAVLEEYIKKDYIRSPKKQERLFAVFPDLQNEPSSPSSSTHSDNTLVSPSLRRTRKDQVKKESAPKRLRLDSQSK